MNENAINEWDIKIWCLKQWNNIKKNLLKQNYLFHRNLQFQKFIKTLPSVLPGCGTIDQTHNIMHNAPQPTSIFPNHYTVVGETPRSTHYTLANSNLHQPLISFLYMIPSCKQYWKDVQTWCNLSMKTHWRGIWLLKQSIIINI